MAALTHPILDWGWGPENKASFPGVEGQVLFLEVGVQGQEEIEVSRRSLRHLTLHYRERRQLLFA